MTPHLKALLILFCGFLGGVLFALSTFQELILIDVDSGNQRRVTQCCWLRVRDEAVENNVFYSVPLAGGDNSLTGKANWKVAFAYRGNSKRSPYVEAGVIASCEGRLGHLFGNLPTEKAARIKKDFLEAVRRRDIDLAKRVVEEAEGAAQR